LPTTRNILTAHTMPIFDAAGMLEMQPISFGQPHCETFTSRTDIGSVILQHVKMVPA